jgi:16S rRNA pseudouridine516 synthase
VTVRGARAAKADAKAALADVAVDGAPLEFPHGVLLLLHKPAGLVCSHDEREGPRVFDLLPERWRARTPALGTVGRLDKDTTGAQACGSTSVPRGRLTAAPRRRAAQARCC